MRIQNKYRISTYHTETNLTPLSNQLTISKLLLRAMYIYTRTLTITSNIIRVLGWITY